MVDIHFSCHHVTVNTVDKPYMKMCKANRLLLKTSGLKIVTTLVFMSSVLLATFAFSPVSKIRI